MSEAGLQDRHMDLTPAQREAVETHTEGPLLVRSAGGGLGQDARDHAADRTTFVREAGVDPRARCLAITFTKQGRRRR